MDYSVHTGGRGTYYPTEASIMKYCCLGVFRKEYFRLITNSANRENTLIHWYSRVV